MAILRIENNLDSNTGRKLSYNINNGNSVGVVDPGGNYKEITPFENDMLSSFSLSGNYKTNHVISYEYRNCTHKLEIIETQNNKPKKIRAVPVLPFTPDINPNIYNIVKAIEKSIPPVLADPETRSLADGIIFINNLGIDIKIDILFRSSTVQLYLKAEKEEKYPKNDEKNWFSEFQIIEAKCPHDNTCSKYSSCQYGNSSDTNCHYHLDIFSKCYPIKMRVDDKANTPSVFRLVGLPPQPQEINITIEPD